jgi:peptide/nickel transport system substrate-binding protein
MLGQRIRRSVMMMYGRSRLLFVLGVTWAGLTLLGLATSTAAAPALPGPATVEKVTIAVEAWGGDSINPVHAKTVNFLWANFLPFLVSRDEQYNIVPALATSWEGSPHGWTFNLNPKAVWEDGTPITAEDVKFSFEATMGMHDFMGNTAGGRMKRSIEAIEVRDQRTVFIKTKAPTANFFLDYSGAGYVGFGIVPKHYQMKVGAEGFAQKPMGGGPYKVKDWVPGHRIVFERNDAFWGESPWYTRPQARLMEIIRVPDGAARFAMLKSEQADVIVPVDTAIAKTLPRQPGKGTWIQPIFGTAKALISFNSLLAAQEGACPAEPYWSCWPKANPEVEVGPFADIRVREALDLAIDKKTISDKVHGGLSTPTGSVFSLSSFGLRQEVAERVIYDPNRAKQLLQEAGYPQGLRPSSTLPRSGRGSPSTWRRW